jgi:hypothetical protein
MDEHLRAKKLLFAVSILHGLFPKFFYKDAHY